MAKCYSIPIKYGKSISVIALQSEMGRKILLL